MWRDKSLIRQIFQELLELEPDESLTAIEGVDPTLLAMHVQMLVEANFIKASISKIQHGWIVHITGITWDGYEYIDKVLEMRRTPPPQTREPRFSSGD